MSAPRSPRRVVLVDDADNAIGEDGVLETHLGAGKRHRAFTAVVLDGVGRVVLARRAPGKMLWPGHWDATVASHPLPGESYTDAGPRRLAEELGVRCGLHWGGRFAYDLPYSDIGSENEVCATLVGRLAPDQRLAPNAAEVSDVDALAVPDLLRRFDGESERFCPWLLLALLSMAGHVDGWPEPVRAPLAPLGERGVAERLRAALGVHFSAGDWTLVK